MRLFISYARIDIALVAQIVELLRAGGHDPWFDHRLLPGQDWKRELHNAIEGCDAFVYMLTPESVASEWCQWEFADAVRVGKPIVPILLRRVDLPESIAKFQYADFSSGITTVTVAQLMGGLTIIIADQPQIGVPEAPDNPEGMPAQVEMESPSLPQMTTEFTPPDLSAWLPAPLGWCEIPSGDVTLTDTSDYLKEPATFNVEGFWMAKYPITNAHYQVFIDATDGYGNPAWWEQQDYGIQQLHNYLEPTSFLGNDMPRTNLRPSQAVAFCKWLTAKTITHFVVSPDKAIYSWKYGLPTEQQWQRAAQGDTSYPYPWGYSYDVRKANTGVSAIGHPTSVTSYPDGVSPFGVMDMIGNVWEMCATSWFTGEYMPDGASVLRGGSFCDDLGYARSEARNWIFPGSSIESRMRRIGFRIVATPVYVFRQ